MPVIHNLFGGSCRDEVISFSSLNTWDALEGPAFYTPLFPTSKKGPRSGASPSAVVSPRVRCEQTSEQHIFKADVQGLRMEDVKVKIEAGVLQVRGEQRTARGREQRWHGGERSVCRFRHRILVPDDAEVDQVRVAIRKGVLTITMPKKEVKQPDEEA